MTPVSAVDLPAIPLHGVHVHDVTMAAVLDVVDGFVRSGRPHQIVTLDASMCVMAARDAELARIIRTADVVTPDSFGVVWACSRAGRPLQERVSGVDLVDRLCAAAACRGYAVYLLGAAPGVADDAAKQLAARHPGCRVVGARHGFFDAAEEPQVVRDVAAARPDVLFVAMGIPRQEKLIDRWRTELGVPVMVGVGGSFDVHSGRVARAPKWMQRLNIEWLHRLARNPRKLGKAMTLPRFALMTLLSSRPDAKQ